MFHNSKKSKPKLKSGFGCCSDEDYTLNLTQVYTPIFIEILFGQSLAEASVFGWWQQPAIRLWPNSIMLLFGPSLVSELRPKLKCFPKDKNAADQTITIRAALQQTENLLSE